MECAYLHIAEANIAITTGYYTQYVQPFIDSGVSSEMKALQKTYLKHRKVQLSLFIKPCLLFMLQSCCSETIVTVCSIPFCERAVRGIKRFRCLVPITSTANNSDLFRCSRIEHFKAFLMTLFTF